MEVQGLDQGLGREKIRGGGSGRKEVVWLQIIVRRPFIFPTECIVGVKLLSKRPDATIVFPLDALAHRCLISSVRWGKKLTGSDV